MGKLFKVNDNLFYMVNQNAKKNVFLNMEPEDTPLPLYADIRDRLPVPVWDGHTDAINCYYKTWELAFGNLRKPVPGTGFVSNFIDTAFNGYLFMWDSSFILMFGKYANRIFNFQKTLDNMYSHQHVDGFICREICETAQGEQFTRDDPASTGPNVMPWAEWEYFQSTGDLDRLSKVFDPLCGYHKWLQLNRSWPDGTYWSCGLACGMDNQPRQPEGYDAGMCHGFMSWIDACAQMYLSGRILIQMAEVLGRSDEVGWLREEAQLLDKVINDKMWDEATGFYYDTRRDGSVSGVKSIAGFWPLFAGLVSRERADRLVAHLEDENEFNRPCPVPSLSYDHPLYSEYGGYWKGGVWAPTNYMVLNGLQQYGYDKLAHEIAEKYLNHVVKTYLTTGTVWENYSPEYPEPGQPARTNFVGWTGLVPVSVMFEYVFGIRPDSREKKIVWDIRLTEAHGIRQYPFGEATLDLLCDARKSADEEPVVHISSDMPVTVEIHWNGTVRTVIAK